MKFLSKWLDLTNWFDLTSHTNKLKRSRSEKHGSLESTQTGSCGGMSSTELKIRIELMLGDLKSTSSVIGPANELAKHSHPTQTFFLSQLSSISDLSFEHAYQLLLASPSALEEMEQEQYENWSGDIKQHLIANDKKMAMDVIGDYTNYCGIDKDKIHIVELNTIMDTIDKLVISIHKSQIPISTQIQEQHFAYTDGYQLYLPSTISTFDNYADNYKLYKILVFHLVGQMHCRTWEALQALEDAEKIHGQDYLDLFSKIETLRIDQIIRHEFPGIWRDIESLNAKSPVDYPEQFFKENDHTSVKSSLHLSNKLIGQATLIPKFIYQPNFLPDQVRNRSIPDSTIDPQVMNPTENVDNLLTDIDTEIKSDSRVYIRNTPQADEQQNSNKFSYNGNSLWDSLPAQSEKSESQDDLPIAKRKEENVFYYKEWDASLNKYRKDWCRVKEVVVDNIPEDKISEPEDSLKYVELRIKKIFDLLINDQKFMRNQSDGDEIDIDAWISARSNINKNTDDYQKLYIRNNINKRDVAILFTVDISGSTSGWKNKAIKQSTWLLCKVLEQLGDQHAIYAFSGSGRNNCRVYPIKNFSEPYSNLVKQRIFSMQPQQYTRMGASIRHLSKILSETSAKTKILFILTDGKPDDVDSYRGNYGVEDTRRAVQEAKALALNPFILTFDKEGLDYLPHMLGRNRYQLISDISELPVQISTIYKHLTA
ncbi:MAG: nitric oxide reductase activation protein NorD [Gammaproteobacteria bacterium]